MSAKRALFLDRDGVINVDKAYVHRKEDFIFVDGVFDLVRHANSIGYQVVVVTNQAGIGRGFYSEEQFLGLMAWVRIQFWRNNARIDGVYFCPHHPESGIGRYCCDCNSRKPAPGMLLRAAREMNIDLSHSIMIGDQETDMMAARRAGISTRILLWQSRIQAREPSEPELETTIVSTLRSAIPLLTD